MNFNGLEFSDYLNVFQKFSWGEWIIFSLVVNLFLYLFSIGLYQFVDKTCRKDKLQKKDHPVTKSDFLLSLLTVICNSFIMLLGVLLWKSEWITLDNNTPAGIIFWKL